MRSLIYILLILLSLQSVYCQELIIQPPEIIAEPITDNYFGIQVTDDFRNLENLQDSTVLRWYKAENSYAEVLLNSITGVDALAKKMKEINNRQEFYVKMINVLDNGNQFYLKKDKISNIYNLYFKKQINDSEILLYSPKDFRKENNENYTINYIQPSWNGNYVIVSLSHSGKEISELIIIDVNTNKILPQILDKAWPSSFLGISWLPDNSGFIYLQFPIVDTDNSEFKKNTQSVLYKLGNDPKDLTVVMGAKEFPLLNIKPNEYPIVSIPSKNSPYLIAYIATVENFWDSYYLPISDIAGASLKWKHFFTKENMVYTDSGIFSENYYIYKSALNSPNFNISSITLDKFNFESPEVLVSERFEEILDEFQKTSDGLFYTTSKNGVEANFYHLLKGKSDKIRLPFNAGKIHLSSKGINSPDLWLNLSGWTSDNERYSYSYLGNTFKKEELATKLKYNEFDDFLVKEILILSHDGLEIPLSIIHNSSIVMDGSNPTLFYGYGAYGDAINPFFSPLFLTWVENGGILCIPHVRGGGEKGEAWHKGGYKATKPNTWKDLISSVEYMINQNYTSSSKTVAYSNSAGGIMIGGAITEKPDLFKSIIIDVGVLNPLRREAFSGSSNYKEYGTVKDSIEFTGLLAMDPYMRLKKDIKYPSGLYMSGMNDPRLPPWMVGKFVAKLRSYNKSNSTILYKVKQDEGHGITSTPDDLYAKWAQMFSFAFWQVGHPDFRLKTEKN